MLRRLTLLRHAKSSWQQADLDDHDRPLNERGERNAPTMGRRLAARGARPSLFITSTAKRARRTARLVARELGYPLEFLQSEPDLYLATPKTMLRILGDQPNNFSDIILCGHNPGITELASQLTGISIDNVPTCGVVVIDVEVEEWSALAPAACQFKYFDYPKAEEPVLPSALR